MHLRPITSSILVLGLLFLSLPAGGCGSEKALPISHEPYGGPPLTVDTRGAQQFVIFTAPSGGWAVRLDRTRRDLFSVDAFITARRPNPAFVHTQALVEHRVATGVPSTTPLAVYLRLLPHDQTDGEPYLPVTAGNVNSAPVPLEVPRPEPGSSAPR